jgi:hypothetical protein
MIRAGEIGIEIEIAIEIGLLEGRLWLALEGVQRPSEDGEPVAHEEHRVRHAKILDLHSGGHRRHSGGNQKAIWCNQEEAISAYLKARGATRKAHALHIRQLWAMCTELDARELLLDDARSTRMRDEETRIRSPVSRRGELDRYVAGIVAEINVQHLGRYHSPIRSADEVHAQLVPCVHPGRRQSSLLLAEEERRTATDLEMSVVGTERMSVGTRRQRGDKLWTPLKWLPATPTTHQSWLDTGSDLKNAPAMDAECGLSPHPTSARHNLQ